MAPSFTGLLDWILPPRCPMTGKLTAETGTLDPSYWAQLTFIQKPFCESCGNPFPVRMTEDVTALRCGKCLQEPPLYHTARAALKYDDASARLVLRLKYADGSVLTPLLTRWLLQAGNEQLVQNDVLIPVPLHRWRLFKRRFNQSALLADRLARAAGLPHWPLALQRIRATESQGHKTRAARLENIRGAFAVPQQWQKKLEGKRVLLLDDVLTSGATVNVCAKALLAGGAQSVDVLTVCRVTHND